MLPQNSCIAKKLYINLSLKYYLAVFRYKGSSFWSNIHFPITGNNTGLKKQCRVCGCTIGSHALISRYVKSVCNLCFSSGMLHPKAVGLVITVHPGLYSLGGAFFGGCPFQRVSFRGMPVIFPHQHRPQAPLQNGPQVQSYPLYPTLTLAGADYKDFKEIASDKRHHLLL